MIGRITCSLWLLAILWQGSAWASTSGQATQDALIRLVRQPKQPSPSELANALHVSLGTPSLDGSTLGALSTMITYPVKRNHRGILSISLYYTIDESGIRESSEILSVMLDRSFCVDPSRLPASMIFKRQEQPGLSAGDNIIPSRVNYVIPHGNVRSSFQLTTYSGEHCANQAFFFAGYGKDKYRPGGPRDAPPGPLIDETSAGKETRLPYALHPPLTAVAFWDKLRYLLQSGHGYITPDQLNKAFQIDLHIASPNGRQGVSRELRARTDWYLPLRYSASGPEFKGTFHDSDGPMSSLAIGLNTYTFQGARGKPDCLSARHVEEDLLASGWKETSSLFSGINTETGRGSKKLVIPNTVAAIHLDIEAYTPNRCLLYITIQGRDPSTQISAH